VEILFAIIVIVEIKVMMILSSNIAAVLYEVLHVLSGWSVVIPIVCFICMVALVLNLVCDQVVFLQIMLSLVA
jgi:hypothetical protein